MTKGAAIVAGAASAALLFATPARADDVDGYLSVLDREGIDTSPRASVVHMGREVCDSFDHGLDLNPILGAITAAGYTKDEAEWIVAASVTKLCPNHKGDVH